MIEERFLGPRFDGGKSPLMVNRRELFEGQTLEYALVVGLPDDTLVTPMGGVSNVREMREALAICGYTPEQYGKLPQLSKDKLLRRIERLLIKRQGGKRMTQEQARNIWGNDAAQARTDLHKKLREWARGDLKLERPQGPSLHHLQRYDLEHGGGPGTILHEEDLQSFVVENNWGALVPGELNGEWRLPFRHICWEFRISGVRVLAMTDASNVEWPQMIMAYGKDHMWVGDDYRYELGQTGMKAHPLVARDNYQFPSVGRLVFANIRASCIMMDAQVADAERCAAPAGLVRRAQQERKTPPRDYHVVRLLKRSARRAGERTGTGVSGYKQGGHWRPGRWLHYDNADSGHEKYINDGGFWLSKSWQRWHFAGDLNRIIEKEYRL